MHGWVLGSGEGGDHHQQPGSCTGKSGCACVCGRGGGEGGQALRKVAAEPLQLVHEQVELRGGVGWGGGGGSLA